MHATRVTFDDPIDHAALGASVTPDAETRDASP